MEHLLYPHQPPTRLLIISMQSTKSSTSETGAHDMCGLVLCGLAWSGSYLSTFSSAPGPWTRSTLSTALKSRITTAKPDNARIKH
eukprot:1157342-Pelagomonas_calceolata.AAC.1